MWSKRDGWNNGLFAILDTGTKENWISPKIVDRFSFEVKDGVPIKYTVFDGWEGCSSATVKATWCIQGQSSTHDNIFRVATENSPFEVLLGRNLIESGEVDFNSECNAIQILVTTKANVSRGGYNLQTQLICATIEE